MKKILLFFILIIAITFTYSGDIRVVTDNYPPYNYPKQNKIVGLSTEIVRKVLDNAGITYSRIEMKPWPRIYKITLYKKNVLIYSIAKTNSRLDKFKWVGQIAPFKVYVYSLKTNKNVQINNLSDLSRYEIGAVKDDIRAQYLIQKGFQSNIEYAENDHKNVLKLLSKRIDVMLNDTISMNYRLEKINVDKSLVKKNFKIDVLSKGLYMAFSRRTSSKIVQKCIDSLNELKKNGKYKKILNNYLE